VRAAVVIANLVLLVFLQAIDPLACADGCAGAEHQHQSSAPEQGRAPVAGDCLLCHGGLTPQAILPTSPPLDARVSAVPDVESVVLSRPAPQLEHPPRLA
jgi:cytochrome c553